MKEEEKLLQNIRFHIWGQERLWELLGACGLGLLDWLHQPSVPSSCHTVIGLQKSCPIFFFFFFNLRCAMVWFWSDHPAEDGWHWEHPVHHAGKSDTVLGWGLATRSTVLRSWTVPAHAVARVGGTFAKPLALVCRKTPLLATEPHPASGNERSHPPFPPSIYSVLFFSSPFLILISKPYRHLILICPF